ncbi:MAG: ribosome biogenesis GTPase Der [Spirochaetales bacterium]|nr:ribosome biogenesis GTPase Der [Spirochaetales bacterium]
MKVPLIAIIGRPNVGKSTLFNRLIRKRRAITDSTPGVTRDPIFEEWDLEGHTVMLADTGGLKLDQEGLDYLVTEKSYAVLKKADVILLMMDITEVTPEDQTLIEALRPYTDKIILVVNKVDNPGREDQIWEFYSYGIKDVVGISSAHGLGIVEMEEALLEMIDFPENEEMEETEDEEKKEIRIAVMGKPNTGKSTLTNQLTGMESSIVSEIPGTTRDVVTGNFTYKGTDYIVLDTAGIRKKKKVGENVEYYSVNRAISTIDEADIILIIIDSVDGLSEQDKKIANLIVQKGKGVILVLNKWDLIKHVPNQLEAITDRTRFLFPILGFAPLVPLSAKTGEGMDNLLDTVWGVWKQLNKRVETGKFNQKLKGWLERYEIPRGSGTYYKILYGTQTSSKPVYFLLFVNHLKGFPQGYLQYLTNNIRKELGFSSIPLEIHLRERRRKG